MFKILLILVLSVVSFSSYAGFIGNLGTSQYYSTQASDEQQRQEYNQWQIDHPGQGGYMPPPPQPVRTDWQCVSDCDNKGYQHQMCMNQCSYVESR